MYLNYSAPSVLWYAEKKPSETKKCPLCGASAYDIQSSGKAGCARCYEIFADILDPYIRKIHGSTVHQGRIPGGGTPGQKQDREIALLRSRLNDAVRSEDYLKAAVLRDKIRELEGE